MKRKDNNINTYKNEIRKSFYSIYKYGVDKDFLNLFLERHKNIKYIVNYKENDFYLDTVDNYDIDNHIHIYSKEDSLIYEKVSITIRIHDMIELDVIGGFNEQRYYDKYKLNTLTREEFNKAELCGSKEKFGIDIIDMILTLIFSVIVSHLILNTEE